MDPVPLLHCTKIERLFPQSKSIFTQKLFLLNSLVKFEAFYEKRLAYLLSNYFNSQCESLTFLGIQGPKDVGRHLVQFSKVAMHRALLKIPLGAYLHLWGLNTLKNLPLCQLHFWCLPVPTPRLWHSLCTDMKKSLVKMPIYIMIHLLLEVWLNILKKDVEQWVMFTYEFNMSKIILYLNLV